ncbi:MAG TPA: phospholipase [Thermoanaerobaculia bacterium]|nr:phospholipase [Thermoanaerobaculia bacterium]
MIERTLATSVHGRFLHVDRGTDRLVIGFHGYAESAEMHLAELEKVPGSERWSLIAVQALHPFYTRTGQIVASWMTSLDRENAMADNLAYVAKVLASVPEPRTLVFAGFSQGATMAARAAAHVGKPAGLMLLGGDIPPDVKADAALRLPPTLLGRGERDEWYTDEKLKKDMSYLEATSRVTTCVFDGGHEWTDAYREAAGRFLEER